jgi:tetratricopeptide (TPR) repeat protein
MTHRFATRLVMAVGVAALAIAGCASPGGGPGGTIGAERGDPVRASASPNSPAVRAWALPGGGQRQPGEGDVLEMLKAADLDGVLWLVRDRPIEDPASAAAGLASVLDDIAAGKVAAARARFEAFPNKTAAGDFVESWLLLAEGDAAAGARRAERAGNLSPQLVGIQAALIWEASGNLIAARATYARLLKELDLTPPPENEARSLEEALRQIQAPQTAQILYRMALTAHRAGETAEARRLYNLVEVFAPRSVDVAKNLGLLEAGRPPFEPALTLQSAMGRWALFLSDEFNRAEGLQKALTDPTPRNELVSPAGTVFGLFGVALANDAEDWKLRMARDLFAINALEGADRVLGRVSASSVFAPESYLLRGYIALRRKDMNAAAAAARNALRTGGDRFEIAMAAAQIYSDAGKDRETIDAFNTAVRVAKEPKDKGAALVGRGYAHLFFGRIDAAVTDARAALSANRQNEAVRIVAIAIFKDRGDTWAEGVALGRELLREHPDSVSRLNQLGYTLIHRAEGLEEGFRLLHRGASLGPTDYAVIDSLGWAHYLYGDFEEALRLIQRANELTGNDPNSEILDHLGDVYWRLGRQEEAKDAWRKALAAGPEVLRRGEIETKLRTGLTTPAPVKRPTPDVEEVVPRERQDT